MKHMLIGVRALDFNGRDGQPVKGFNLYVSFLSDGVVGRETSRVFVRNVPDDFPSYIGHEVDINFDGKGRVINVDWKPKA